MPKFSIVQSKKRNFGGVEKASSSVLKLVRIIQRIGKKIRKPTSQAAAVTSDVRRTERARAMVQASRFRPIMRTRKKATMLARMTATDRKSTRLNSSHGYIS